MKINRFKYKPGKKALISTELTPTQLKKRKLRALKEIQRIEKVSICLNKSADLIEPDRKIRLHSEKNDSLDIIYEEKPEEEKKPFDMIKPVEPAKNVSNCAFCSLDIETVSIELTELTPELQIILLDSNNEGDFSNHLLSRLDILNSERSPAVRIPIAVGISKAKDIETVHISDSDQIETRLFSIGEITDNPEEIVDKSFKMMEDVIIYIKDLKDTVYKDYDKLFFYAHYGGGYDAFIIIFYFLKLEMHRITGKRLGFRKNKSKYLTVTLGKGIYLRDSIQMLDSGLDKLGKDLLGEGKMELPIKRFPIKALKPGPDQKVSHEKLLDYLKQDCVLLLKILYTFNEYLLTNFNVNFYEKLTISSLTVYIFFKNYYNPQKNSKKNKWDEAIYVLNKEQEKAVRSSYHGGRTQVFKTHIGKGVVYDLNNAYVAAMMYKDLPIGQPKGPYHIEDGVGFFHYQLNNFFGFAKAKIYTPADVCKPTALPFKLDNGLLVFPSGSFEGWFFSEELKAAKEVGYLIIVNEIIYFDKSKTLFKDYLSIITNLRTQYPKTHPYNYFSKKLGNAGRFAMQTENEKHHICYTERQIEKLMENYQVLEIFPISTKKTNTVFSIEARKIDDNMGHDPYSVKFKVKQLQEKVAPHISAAIASYIRIELMKALFQDIDRSVAYVDTDSLFVEGDFEPPNIHETRPGAWKIDSVFNEAFIFAPKFYRLIFTDPKTGETKIKFKVKGLSEPYKKEIDQENLVAMLDKEKRTLSFKGDVELGKTILKGDKSNFMMFERPRSMTLSSETVSNHCVKIYDENNKWIIAQPFIVVNGEISDLETYTPHFIETKILFDNYCKEITRNEYFEKVKQIKEYSIKEFKIKKYQSDPLNLPGLQKVDTEKGTFVRKTEQELKESYTLTSEKYQTLLSLRFLKDSLHSLGYKQEKLLNQLELILIEFKTEFSCQEEDVPDLLKNKQKALTDALAKERKEFVKSLYKNKQVLENMLALLKKQEKLLSEE